MSHSSLLEDIRTKITIDVDSMDPTVAARHSPAVGGKFCDMTSNQAIVYSEAARPERADILKTAVAKAKAKGGSEEDIVENALDILTVLFAKEVYPFLTGRVHAQASPPAAYDTPKTIAHAERLVALFEAEGIPKSRVCIKIPATPESIVAMAHLEKEGIRTLATCLFSVQQAVAASQAGCLYVAPYFNELRVHFEPSVWKSYTDTAKEHPMSPVIGNIVKTFRRLSSKTLVMPASIVTSAEVVALASLHPDHLTLAGGVLDQLASEPPSQNASEAADDPKPHHPDLDAPSAVPVDSDTPSVLSPQSTDFLTNGADALRQALAADSEATRKLADALKIFGEMEDKTRLLIRDQLHTIH